MKEALILVTAFVVVSAGALGAGAFRHWKRHASAIPPGASGPSEVAGAPVPSEVRAELNELRDQLATMRSVAQTQLALQSQSAAHAVPAQPNTPQPAGDSTSESTPDAAAERQRIAEKYERQIRSEPIEIDWSRRQVANIRESLTKAIPDATIAEITCATTLCRVVVEHDSPEGQTELARVAAPEAPFAAGTAYYYGTTPAGAWTTTLYVHRAYPSAPAE